MVEFNPFIISGYKSPEYFCDREQETQQLCEHIMNQRNVALISPRRLGKSGLILNAFHQNEIQDNYHTFYVDIYDTKNLTEFTYFFGKCVVEGLKSRGQKVWESFVNALKSMKLGVTFDMFGNPEWNVSMGEIHTPDLVLDEIFYYLEHADKPCIVAFEEFQVVADYPEKTVEATLRKRIQMCHNVNFIFSGSKQHMMSEMFASHARPFYNSTTLMGLDPIDRKVYLEFANKHLASNRQSISADAFNYLYDWSEGVTWYIQSMLNELYARKENDIEFGRKYVEMALQTILQRSAFAYKALLYQLAPKQKAVLYAIAREGKVEKLMSQRFLQSNSLTASTVQGAIKILLERDFVTFDEGQYMLQDRFFEEWIRNNNKYGEAPVPHGASDRQ